MALVVMSTGGTIASTETEGEGASPDLTGEDLVAAVPGLDEVASVRTEDFSNVPSPHFSVEQMADLAVRVQELDTEAGVEGIVITQGTDILEESAYFVELCYGGSTPVVFTGAMRNPSLASPDGAANVLASARVATHPAAVDNGVLVCLNDRVHLPATVTKAHSMNVDAFRSPEFGPVATVDESWVNWHLSQKAETPVFDPPREALSRDVHAVIATADMPRAQIGAAADSAGLCLAATGAGHIPPRIIPTLEELRADAVPVVATTRCPEGRLARETYGFEGSERTLRELGSYYSTRNLQKTRIKTIIALAVDRLDDAFVRPG